MISVFEEQEILTLDLGRDSAKWNVFCAITKDTIHDPSFPWAHRHK